MAGTARECKNQFMIYTGSAGCSAVPAFDAAWPGEWQIDIEGASSTVDFARYGPDRSDRSARSVTSNEISGRWITVVGLRLHERVIDERVRTMQCPRFLRIAGECSPVDAAE